MYFTDTPELRKFEKEMKQVPNFDREKVGDNISCDSNYSVNKNYNKIDKEVNKSVKNLLYKDMDFLDSIQSETSTARQFLFIARCKSSKSENVLQKANRVEKIISDQGFEVTRMKKADIERFLAIYFEASMNGDLMPDYDGEQYISEVENEEA